MKEPWVPGRLPRKLRGTGARGPVTGHVTCGGKPTYLAVLSNAPESTVHLSFKRILLVGEYSVWF